MSTSFMGFDDSFNDRMYKDAQKDQTEEPPDCLLVEVGNRYANWVLMDVHVPIFIWYAFHSLSLAKQIKNLYYAYYILMYSEVYL